MNSATAASPRPTTSAPTTSLATAFRGIWRLTFPKFLTWSHLGVVLLGVAIVGLLAGVQGRHDGAHFLNWITTTYLSFLIPLFAFVQGAGTIRDEMKSATVDYVLTRAIPRPAFVGFKYLAAQAGHQIECLLALIVLVVVARLVGVPGLPAMLPTLVICQILLVFAFSGFGFLCGTLTSRYIIIGLVYGAIVEVGVGQIPTQLSRLSMTHSVRSVLQRFTDPALSDPAQASGLPGTVGALLTFTVLTLGIATVVFSLRELSSNAEA